MVCTLENSKHDSAALLQNPTQSAQRMLQEEVSVEFFSTIYVFTITRSKLFMAKNYDYEKGLFLKWK